MTSRRRDKKKVAGRVKPGERAPRRLELKFRVRPLVRMPVSVMFQKLQGFVKTGVAPDDLEVAYMEYAHGRGRRYQPGERISADDQEELAKFYNAMISIPPEEVSVDNRKGKYTRNARIGYPDTGQGEG